MMNNIDRKVEVGNISSTYGRDLKALTSLLYMKIYSKYQEMEEFIMRLYDQQEEAADISASFLFSFFLKYPLKIYAKLPINIVRKEMYSKKEE